MAENGKVKGKKMLNQPNPVQGLTRKQIASAMGLSVKTVERNFGTMLRSAEMRCSRRERVYDPQRANRILIRQRAICRPI